MQTSEHELCGLSWAGLAGIALEPSSRGQLLRWSSRSRVICISCISLVCLLSKIVQVRHVHECLLCGRDVGLEVGGNGEGKGGGTREGRFEKCQEIRVGSLGDKG